MRLVNELETADSQSTARLWIQRDSLGGHVTLEWSRLRSDKLACRSTQQPRGALHFPAPTTYCVDADPWTASHLSSGCVRYWWDSLQKWDLILMGFRRGCRTGQRPRFTQAIKHLAGNFRRVTPTVVQTYTPPTNVFDVILHVLRAMLAAMTAVTIGVARRRVVGTAHQFALPSRTPNRLRVAWTTVGTSSSRSGL